MSSAPPLGPLIQAFFAEHLVLHKSVSPHTVATYRDCFRLLLRFVQSAKHREPSRLSVADLDAPVILAFLDHLETLRGNSVRSRNARLAAIRSFFRFVALYAPESVALTSRVLAIPVKRSDHRLVGYLTQPQVEAILSAPDRRHWRGRRDHALLLTMYNSGARVSEIVGVRASHVVLGTTRLLQLQGKGRKQRAVPLWPRTGRVLRSWFEETAPAADHPAFPRAPHDGPLSRFGVGYLLRQAARRASATCPDLRGLRVFPHLLRHTTAMHLLQSGVDPSVIALWLGHESVETTHSYIEADLAMKERALARWAPAKGTARRFKAQEPLLAFLESL